MAVTSGVDDVGDLLIVLPVKVSGCARVVGDELGFIFIFILFNKIRKKIKLLIN